MPEDLNCASPLSGSDRTCAARCDDPVVGDTRLHVRDRITRNDIHTRRRRPDDRPWCDNHSHSVPPCRERAISYAILCSSDNVDRVTRQEGDLTGRIVRSASNHRPAASAITHRNIPVDRNARSIRGDHIGLRTSRADERWSRDRGKYRQWEYFRRDGCGVIAISCRCGRSDRINCRSRDIRECQIKRRTGCTELWDRSAVRIDGPHGR